MVERAKLQGRDQEWNISYKELQELVRMVLHLLLLPHPCGRGRLGGSCFPHQGCRGV